MKMRKNSSRIEDLEVVVMMADNRPMVVLGCKDQFPVERRNRGIDDLRKPSYSLRLGMLAL